MPRKVEVYDLETGTVVPMWSLDADRVTKDFPERWSRDRPRASMRVPATEPAGSVPAVGAVVETAAPPPAQAETTASQTPELATPPSKGEVEPGPPKDDLTVINGIGPALARHLAEAGIDSFAKLAAMTPAEVTDFEIAMKFRGRMAREEWQEQASKLATEAST